MSTHLHDQKAERAVVAAAITNPELTRTLKLNESQFYNPLLGAAWQAIANLHADRQAITPPAIVHQAQPARIDHAMILDLIGDAPHLFDINGYADAITDMAERRRLTEHITRLGGMISGGHDLEAIQSELGALTPHHGDAIADEMETLDEFTSHDLGEEEWVIDGLLAKGERLVLTGGEGAGKTMFCRSVAVLLACGLDPFTLVDHEPKNVLVVDCENPRRIMQNSFKQLKAAAAFKGKSAGSRLMIQRRPDGLTLSDPKDRLWLHQRCELTNPDLLVIGPIYKLDVGAKRTGDPELDTLATTRGLDAIRAEFDCALLMEHHAPHGKDGVRDLRPYGSSVWLRWPEFGFGLKLDPSQSTHGSRFADVIPWRGNRDDRAWPTELSSAPALGIPWVDHNAVPRRKSA